ncbi:hypothetical protein CJ030_MR7G000057 [Morella rubra]|uniref:Uncharacterized protein n=1 Tax=Morella rubra TaxID=262757 RepID=A0A6A1V3R7_9ROSI|nr:hypothetical protein CJ030_MR7G000057 [Morella rubra]
MEDRNMLAADCVVISCCCQCLILQVVIFVFLKLPHKLIRKTRDCARRKRRQRKRDKKIIETETGRYRDDFVGMRGASFRIQVDEFSIDGGHGCGTCMEEVEKVLEELSQKGQFAFGSFWGRKASGSSSTCVTKQEFENSIVQYQVTEIIGAFSYSIA